MDESDRNIYLEDIPLDDAWARFESALRHAGRWQEVSGETIPLSDALGRVLADPVWAKLSSPHYHAAAMDGYAVDATHTIGATETRPIQLTLNQQAVPVNTGDRLPENTNAVVMIEHIHHPDANTVEIRAPVAPWQHVRMVGEDMIATELVLPANHTIRPVDIGAIAGCGHAEVTVRRRPHVIIIPTGDELVAAGTIPKPGQIIEYNSLVLRAQILEAGGTATIVRPVGDNYELLQQAVQATIGSQPDLILVLSGSSAGSKDFTAQVLRDVGKLLVHGVAVRPGHPVIIGMLDDIPVIGIPGYPVSAALTGELFVQPLLARWLGVLPEREQRPRIHAKLTRKLMSPTGDDDFVRVTVADVDGQLLATPLSRGAGVITSLVRADGLAHIPRFSEGADAGQSVEVSLYRPLHHIHRALLAVGSHDPMLDLLAQHLAADSPGSRLVSVNVGSIGGLLALRRREGHLAGVHLLDTDTGEYNHAYVQQYLPDEPVQLVTFAHREQGFIVAKRNPHNIQSFDDLPRVRFVNRQRGAGTRLLLDYELQRRSIETSQIDGYEHEEYTHLAVATAVASGIADCGLGVRSAAMAMNLDFVSVGWERYDLVIPERHAHHPVMVELLGTLRSPTFQSALSAQPGYDTRETGHIQQK